MAIMRLGLLSFFKNSNDKRKPEYYLKLGIKKPVKKKSKRPITENQMAQRLKFALAIKFVTSIRSVTAIGFRSVKKYEMSPTNVAAQAVLKESIVGEYPNFKIDFEKVRISSGPLSISYGFSCSFMEVHLVEICWENLEGWKYDRSFSDHFIHILLYDDKGEQSIIELEAGRRGDCKLQISLPRYFEGASLHCWAFFSTENHKIVSQSIYLGELIP